MYRWISCVRWKDLKDQIKYKMVKPDQEDRRGKFGQLDTLNEVHNVDKPDKLR